MSAEWLPRDVKAPAHIPYAGYEWNVMTNFDHSIDQALAEEIHAGKKIGTYTGWDFYGKKVWYDGRRWLCEIWTYGAHRETVAAESLEEIMEAVSDRYGER